MEVWEAVVLGLVQGLRVLPVTVPAIYNFQYVVRSSGEEPDFRRRGARRYGMQHDCGFPQRTGPVDRRIFVPVERRNDLYLQNNAFDGTGGDRRFFFKDYVEELSHPDCWSWDFVADYGCMARHAYYARPRQKVEISFKDAFVIGLAQAFAAILPGLRVPDRLFRPD